MKSESPTITRQGTETGVILGTAAYMSPEQARGKTVDKRADIWAFGCVLYEALTGRKMFDGNTVADVLASIIRAEPSWERLPDDTTWKIRELLRRCLEKDTRRRLRDIGEAWVAIEDASSVPFPSGAVEGGRRGQKRATPFVLTALAAIVLGGFIVWLLRPPAAPKLPVRSVIPLEPGDELAINNTSPSVAISPDGRSVAYVVKRGDSTQIYIRALNEMEAKLLDTTERGQTPFFSPDGQWVGFARVQS